MYQYWFIFCTLVFFLLFVFLLSLRSAHLHAFSHFDESFWLFCVTVEMEHRIDYELREGLVESRYWSAVTSHTAYWSSHDVALFLLTFIYRQQTVNTETVQHTWLSQMHTCCTFTSGPYGTFKKAQQNWFFCKFSVPDHGESVQG